MVHNEARTTTLLSYYNISYLFNLFSNLKYINKSDVVLFMYPETPV